MVYVVKTLRYNYTKNISRYNYTKDIDILSIINFFKILTFRPRPTPKHPMFNGHKKHPDL